MQRIKTALLVLGAVTALVLAGNGVALAATGKGFVLGKANSAKTVTTLKRTTPGPALALKGTSKAGVPFTVNGRGKVGNLNADLLDGLDSSQLRPRTFLWQKTIDDADAKTDQSIRLNGLAPGTYQVGYSTFAKGLQNGDVLGCFFSQHSTSSLTGYFGETETLVSSNQNFGVSGTAILTVKKGDNVDLICGSTHAWSTDNLEPIQIYANPVQLAKLTQ